MSDTNSTTSVSAESASLWKIEFNKRIQLFAKEVGLLESDVLTALAKIGVDGQNERSLKLLDNEQWLTMQDLFECFCDTGILPKSVLRMGIAELRGKTPGVTYAATETSDAVSAIKDMISSNRPKSDWSDRELLEHYDRDATEIIEILHKRTRGRPCKVFNDDNTLNIAESEKLVRIAKRQPTLEVIIIGDKAFKVYPADKFPDETIDASPFFPQFPLVDGYCSQSDTNWNGINKELRILAHLQARYIEKTINMRDLKEIHDAAKTATMIGRTDGDNIMRIRMREKFPRAALKYDELEKLNKLPTLQIVGDITKGCDTGFVG